MPLIVADAPKGRSVWDRVGLSTFEADVAQLRQYTSKRWSAHVPEPFVPPESDALRDSDAYRLPIGTEAQLANGIAFVTAHEARAASVTACAVQEIEGSLMLRVAANEGLHPDAQAALDRVIRAMEKCAREGRGRQECLNDIFDEVVSLNLNRILGRLGSVHHRRPAHVSDDQVLRPLCERLQGLVDSLPCLKRDAVEVDRARLQSELTELTSSMVQLNEADRSSWPDHVKDLVKLAYDMTRDGRSFASRMVQLNMDGKGGRNRAIADVTKVANYWTVSRFLANTSRTSRNLCRPISLKVIEPFRPSRGQGPTKFVHAEVQIMVDIELSGAQPWPRIIAASKERCFLCHALFESHGCFAKVKAHRALLDAWTVPDLSGYSEETLARMRRALIAVNELVKKEIIIAQKPHRFRPFPGQSSVDLHHWLTPPLSVTSISVVSSGKSVETLTPRGGAGGEQHSTGRLDGSTPTAVKSIQRTPEQHAPFERASLEVVDEDLPPKAQHPGLVDASPSFGTKGEESRGEEQQSAPEERASDLGIKGEKTPSPPGAPSVEQHPRTLDMNPISEVMKTKLAPIIRHCEPVGMGLASTEKHTPAKQPSEPKDTRFSSDAADSRASPSSAEWQTLSSSPAIIPTGSLNLHLSYDGTSSPHLARGSRKFLETGDREYSKCAIQVEQAEGAFPASCEEVVLGDLAIGNEVILRRQDEDEDEESDDERAPRMDIAFVDGKGQSTLLSIKWSAV